MQGLVNYSNRSFSHKNQQPLLKSVSLNKQGWLYWVSIGYWYQVETLRTRTEYSHQTNTFPWCFAGGKLRRRKKHQQWKHKRERGDKRVITGVQYLTQYWTCNLKTILFYIQWMSHTVKYSTHKPPVLHLASSTKTLPCSRKWIRYGYFQGHSVGP